MKFRKKPVVIEATQWFKLGDHPAVFYNHNSVPTIKTLEGEMFVRSGDWIITGVKGEHYPCKPDIFEMTYEPVEEAAPAHPPQRTEQNFCSRCGKRTADLTTIHTCTPPQD